MENHPIYEQEGENFTEFPTPNEANTIIAHVGNSEAKCILLAALQPDTVYDGMALQKLFISIQGDDPVWTPNPSGAINFCKRSFMFSDRISPIVEITPGVIMLTEWGRKYIVPLAAHLAAYSYEYPELSLYRLLGQTASTSTQKSPARRIALLKALKDQEAPIPEKELFSLLDLPPSYGLINSHLISLAASGVIAYSRHQIGKNYAQYQMDKDAPSPDFSDPLFHRSFLATTRNVYTLLQSGEEYMIDALTEAYIHQFPSPASKRRSQNGRDRYRKNLISEIRKALSDLAKAGAILIHKDESARNAFVALQPQHKEAIAQLLFFIDQFVSRDPSFFTKGEHLAPTITQDEECVKVLLVKAREASTQKDRNTAYIRMEFIDGLIHNDRSITNWEIAQEYMKKFDKYISLDQVWSIHKSY